MSHYSLRSDVPGYKRNNPPTGRTCLSLSLSLSLCIFLERNDPETRIAAERKRCPNNPEAMVEAMGYLLRSSHRHPLRVFVLTYRCATFVVCGTAYVTACPIGRSHPLARYVSRDYWHAFKSQDGSRLLRHESERTHRTRARELAREWHDLFRDRTSPPLFPFSRIKIYQKICIIIKTYSLSNF